MLRQVARIVPPIQIRSQEALPVPATQVLLYRMTARVRNNAAPDTPDPTGARVRHASPANTKRRLERRHARIVLTIPFHPLPARK